MTRFDIFDIIDRLRREGRPFCVATVVRTADVTSAKAGAKAAITAEGEVLGHLGGACVQRAVRKAAAAALDRGEAGMISVRPSRPDDPGETVEVHLSGCPSGGTVDLFIEPYTVPERVVVLGDTPIGRAIAAHAGLMGFAVSEAAAGDAVSAGARDFVIIASQGTGDAAAIRAALETGAGHIAMVASRRKAETLRARLADQGMAQDQLDRIKAPAGLDLGGIDPHEIAISVLAEIVRHRHAARRAPGM